MPRLGLRGYKGFRGSCPLCGNPIRVSDKCHFDHVMPVSVRTDPHKFQQPEAQRLARILLCSGLETWGRGPDLQVVHARCNLQKGSTIILPDDCDIDDVQIDDMGIDDAD